MRKFDEFFQEARRKLIETVGYDPTQEEIINNSDNIPTTMGKGRNYNNPIDEEDEGQKTSKIKKITITQEESNAAEASDEKEVPTPQAGEKPISEREPSEEEGDTATTDEDRYRASSTG